MSYAIPAVLAAAGRTMPDEAFLRRGRWVTTYAVAERRSRELARCLSDGNRFRWGGRDPLACPELLLAVLRMGVVADLDITTGRDETGTAYLDPDAREVSVHSGTPALRLPGGALLDHGALLDRGRALGERRGLASGATLDGAAVGADPVDRAVAVVAALMVPCSVDLPGGTGT